MDDEDLVRTGMEVVLAPVTAVAEDVLGALAGDWLREVRLRNRNRLRDNTAKIMSERHITHAQPPSPSVLLPLLGAAQEESRAELQDIWARLLAYSIAPDTQHRFRKRFVDITRGLDPLDASVLMHWKAAVEARDNLRNERRSLEIEAANLWRLDNDVEREAREKDIFRRTGEITARLNAGLSGEFSDRLDRAAAQCETSMENLFHMGLIRDGELTALGREFLDAVSVPI